jgi:hypothetical protein
MYKINCYNKKVILFQVGASGHFLAEFLTTEDITVLPTQRIDHRQRLSSVFVDETRPEYQFKGGCSTDCVNAIKKAITGDDPRIILSHCDTISEFRQLTDRAWIKKILPDTNFFGWIKNAVYKTHDIDHVIKQGMPQQIDFFFTNLKHWSEINRADQDRPKDMTIDFGKLYNIQYLKDLYRSANGCDPNADRIEFAEQYISKQFDPMHDCESTNIMDIIDHVDPHDSFGIATALFMYENNHNSIDQNRQWTINDFPDHITGCIEFLVAHSQNYLFLKDLNC